MIMSTPSTMNTKSLPEEIITEILIRLPVKSIIRFKSVSKHWYSLLTDRHFSAAHLHHHSSSSSTSSLLIVRHGTSLGNLTTSVFNVNLATLYRNLSVPENRLDDRSPSIIGSCNGLLCIQFCSDNILFWNPATKSSRQVPSFNLRSQFTHLTTRFVSIGECPGFGFNSEIGDYKLVKFAMFYYKDWRAEDQAIWDDVLEVKAVVFSWKTWSWKVLKNTHNIPAATYDNQVAANGHLYWIGSRDGMRDFVLAFDLVSDSFRTIEWTTTTTSDDQNMYRLDMETRVAVFKSCLMGLTEDNDDDFEVLVMSENGARVEGTDWEKLWSYGCFDGYYDYGGYWNGLQVIRRRGSYRSYLYLFCPRSNVVRLLDDISIRFYGVVNYVESLVPVTGIDQ